MEERMWGVLRPFFSKKGEAAAARRLNHGLWKAPHVSQICHWDCGVSCAQMVLRGLGREAERSSLLASLGTRSVWTIDLAMLLHRQGVRFMYGTRTAGVTEAYSTIDFYRANFDHDAPRVQSLFKAARLESPPASGGDRAASPPRDSSYCGHYILLVGWSEADGVFIARDPALPSSTPSTATAPGGAGGGDPNAHACIALTPEALDRARRSYGTDEDVLVIDLARSRKGGVPTAPLAAAAAATALAASAASSAAAASAMVGILAMAAAAAAAGAEASGFKEWAWPDRAAWFSGHHAAVVDSAANVDGTGGAGASGGDEVVGRRGVPLSGAESAARRLASLLSLAASGLRFPTVGDAYRGPGVLWGNGATGGGGGGGGSGSGSGSGADAEEKEEQERWAVRMASAMLLEGGRRAVYTMEGLLQGGRRAAYTMEGFLQGGANTMEGLLQGGRRAAYTMEGLLEGGRRAAYNLRDQLADVADAPGGAGAECCSIAVLTSPGSPVSPARLPVVSPA
ncbi:chromosome 22 open reading frame 13, isoform CRA_c [Ectocarpus siliculosus]|uniref:Chromosome 22 open reading frame 13, isoform CRA_c n=1 Tax=Ectocarpus siliculosus TaxID=2880 RepID=D8LB31_ECTSI|nr:chromosome 22 open reading frame 13, isoform CRA_c [Ectocarpus siliculosus]|eukprot:CBN76540.1 chromosome 22 open reading frame 13, isoform CRA_c [Ectocarpus siliculosus]